MVAITPMFIMHLDDFGGLDRHLLRQLGHRDGLADADFALDRRGGHLEGVLPRRSTERQPACLDAALLLVARADIAGDMQLLAAVAGMLWRRGSAGRGARCGCSLAGASPARDARGSRAAALRAPRGSRGGCASSSRAALLGLAARALPARRRARLLLPRRGGASRPPGARARGARLSARSRLGCCAASSASRLLRRSLPAARAPAPRARRA